MNSLLLEKVKHSLVIHLVTTEGLHGLLHKVLRSHEIYTRKGSLEYVLEELS